MESVDLIRRLHQHRVWVNRMLLTTAKQLSDQQLHRSFEIGQQTIWKSLTHLYGGEYVWLETLRGNEARQESAESSNSTKMRRWRLRSTRPTADP